MTLNDLKFLSGLAKHNDRTWFQKHKVDFEAAQKSFTELVSGLIFALSEYDEDLSTIDAKSCVFRIYRDVRFSKDKSPYKTHFAAYICAGGRKSETLPGYYLHIEPGGKSMFGAGYYMPAKNVLDNLKQDIIRPKSRIVQAITDKPFRKIFPHLAEEDKAKKVPPGFDKEHPQAELLKMKHFFVYANFSDSSITNKKFLAELGKSGKALSVWNQMLLNTAKGR